VLGSQASGPEGKLKPTEAQRRGKYYLVWTERGKKREQKINGNTFEDAVKAARSKRGIWKMLLMASNDLIH